MQCHIYQMKRMWINKHWQQIVISIFIGIFRSMNIYLFIFNTIFRQMSLSKKQIQNHWQKWCIFNIINIGIIRSISNEKIVGTRNEKIYNKYPNVVNSPSFLHIYICAINSNAVWSSFNAQVLFRFPFFVNIMIVFFFSLSRCHNFSFGWSVVIYYDSVSVYHRTKKRKETSNRSARLFT